MTALFWYYEGMYVSVPLFIQFSNRVELMECGFQFYIIMLKTNVVSTYLLILGLFVVVYQALCWN